MAVASSISDCHGMTSKIGHLHCLERMCRHSSPDPDAWNPGCQHCAQKQSSPWTCLTGCQACHAVVLSSSVCLHMYHPVSRKNRRVTPKDPNFVTCWISSSLPGVLIHIHVDVHSLQGGVDRQGCGGTRQGNLSIVKCNLLLFGC